MHRGLKSAIVRFFLHYLRMWDLSSINRVDHFIANSKFIAQRIKKIYGVEAFYIYPPVDTDFFELEEKKDDYYIAASRLVPYKKIDLIVEAFSHMPDKKLLVVGSGPEMAKIKAKAKKNIEIVGYKDNLFLKRHIQKAKALVFASIEDFGILPVEAMAAGTPVIALRKGGALETVQENVSGLFFEEQEVSSIIQAVEDFEKKQLLFIPSIISEYAKRFSISRFKKEYRDFVLSKYEEFKAKETV